MSDKSLTESELNAKGYVRGYHRLSKAWFSGFFFPEGFCLQLSDSLFTQIPQMLEKHFGKNTSRFR